MIAGKPMAAADDVAGNGSDESPWRNLGELVLEAASRHGTKVAFRMRRGYRLRSFTFEEVGRLALRTGAFLVQQGLVPGDRVAIRSPNLPEYAVLYFGAWLAGLVVVPIDMRTGPEVESRFLKAASPKLGFRSSMLPGTYPDTVPQTLNLEDLLELVSDANPAWRPPAIDPGHLAEICFTSGTTGVPKGVMLTHANLVAQIEGLQKAFPLEPDYRALSLLPLSHVYEQVVDLLLAFSSGVRMTYLPRINPAALLRALQEERITCFVLVPELLRMVLNGIETQAAATGGSRHWQLALRFGGRLPFPLRRLLFRQVHRALGGSVIFIGCASAPLDHKLATTWERMGIRIVEGYGLSEIAGAASLNTWTRSRRGSVGRPMPGIAVRIASDGEIQVQGPTVMKGYLEQPELTARSFTPDGWLRTGDVGRLDTAGFLYVVGREAFKIVLADGRKAYPEDVERALNAHPLVRESCVVPLAGSRGESVHAVLLTEHSDQATAIVADANARLEDHERITSFSVWGQPDFPRTPILKIDRKLVQAAVQAGPSEPSKGGAAVLAADPVAAIAARLAATEGRSISVVEEGSRLQDDLGLDSIGRLELLAALEDELGVVIPELDVGPATTIKQLRELVANATPEVRYRSGPRWPRSAWAGVLRRGLLWIGFRLQDHWMQMEVVHQERAGQIPLPSILIFNYQGPYVPLAMLRALPQAIRSRVACAADSRLWQGRDRWQGWLTALAAQAFPFVKSGGGEMRSGLDEMARWLDDGYAVIASPEGNPEFSGEMLPFLTGTGLMAVEMQVPVVPFRIDGYHPLFPPPGLPFPYLPNRRGRFRLIIGEPVRIDPGTSPKRATELLQQAMIDTR
jgi:long-chain acyl-CoA synthetase